MPVYIRYSTGFKRMTPDSARSWAGQEGRQLLDVNLRGILPMFIENWNQTSESTQYLMFLSHIKIYMEQVELLRGIRDIGLHIQATYPVQAYLYVGVGRSPAPLIAYFQNINIRAQTIPLSNFRPRNVTWSITDDLPIGRGPQTPQRITLEQQPNLFSHFARYFPGRPARSKILLIDYTQTAQSLVAAQEQLQLFFQSRQESIEVHALALCRDSDAAQVHNIGVMVGRIRNPIWNPIDWFSYSGQRQQFAQRWHVLPLAQWGELQTQRQQLVMRAFSAQTFDDLAEYDSFPILTQASNLQPTRYTNNPNEPAAYDVLRGELCNT